MAKNPNDQERGLPQIKERLRAGKLTQEDVARLEDIVVKAEEAIRQLRAAVVE
jgi:hypothetical protein